MDLKIDDGLARRSPKGEVGWMLGQGTIYPDTIETGGAKHADHIKTHHNRVDAIQKMIEQGLIIEPLRDLYKDEVRTLGEELGLPHALVWRHPFPGPGLGVRILCASGQQAAGSGQPKMADVHSSNVVLPIRSVGVQGDGRTYRHALALFSNDPTTITKEEWDAATTIPNTNREINRVLKCLSHTHSIAFVPGTGFVTRVRADLLREADAIAMEELEREGMSGAVWQFPVVLLPFGTRDDGQSIVLRPIESTDAMTANAASLPSDLLQRITKRILDLPGIDAVFYDLTTKPPGTIEWE